MKFGKYIESEAVPEWHTKYLNYKLLKKCLKRITATKKDLTGESVPILPIGLELEYGSHRVGGENSSIQGTRGNYLMNTAKPSKTYQSTQHIHGHGFLSEVPDVKGSNEYEAWLHREESNVSASLPRDLERSFGGRRIHSRENLAKENQMGNTSTSGVSSAVVGELEPAKDGVRRRINSMSEKNATSGKRDEAVVVIKKNSTRYSPEHVYKMYASEEMFYNALDMRSLGEQEFFRLVNEELQKINSFYREKEELFYTRFVAICNQLEILRHKIQENAFSKALGSEKKKSLEFSKGKKVLWTIKSMIEEALKVSEKENNEEAKQKTDVSVTRAFQKLKKATLEVHRGMEMLKNYRILNHTGIVKIMKKYRKTTNWNNGADYYLNILNSNYFEKSPKLEEMLRGVENLYRINFSNGSLQQAKTELRMPLNVYSVHRESIFKSGFNVGLSIPLLAQILYMCLSEKIPENLTIVLQIYYCLFLVLFYFVLTSVNMLAWFRARINYKFIFIFDPRDNLSPWQFFKICSSLLLFVLGVVYTNLLISPYLPNPNIMVLSLLVLLLTFLFLPLNLLYWSSRRWLLISLKRILLPGFYTVEFRDFFLADIMCSLSYSMNIFYLIGCGSSLNWTNVGDKCLSTHNVGSYLLMSLPHLIRFIQCIRRYRDSSEAFPHIANALKYFANYATIWLRYFDTVPPAVLLSAHVISTCYSIYWDLYMDWGFFESDSPHLFLRRELKYRSLIPYYIALISNPLLRFSIWLLPYYVFPKSIYLRHILAFVEALRRYQWCFFRLENEQVNNCGRFRATLDIPLPFAVSSRTVDKLPPENLDIV